MTRLNEPRRSDSRYEERYQAATLYYLMGETMEAIAQQLARSRSTVSRLLQEARDQGLVRIALADTASSASPVALELRRHFGTRVHLVAVRSDATDSVRLEEVAKRAGALLTETLGDHQVIGVAWGRAVARSVQHIASRALVGVKAVQLNGNASPQGPGVAYTVEILQSLGDAFAAELMLFPVPAFFDQAATRDLMWKERSVRRVLRLRKRVDVAIFGVGSLQTRSASEARAGGYLTDEEVEQLTGDGVVGDVCTVLLREDGSYADIPLNQRATGPSPDELRLIPRRICVAADASRAAALLGALRAGVVTDLVVDEATARTVLSRLG